MSDDVENEPSTNDDASQNSDSPEGSGLFGEFFEFVGDFQSLVALMAKMAVAAPLLDFIFKVGPPWPNRPATAFFIVVFQVLVLIYAFEFWRHRSMAMKRVRQSLKYFIFATPIALILYIVLFSFYISDFSTTALDENDKQLITTKRYVAGRTLLEGPQIMKDVDGASNQELIEAFADADHAEGLDKELEKVWTRESLVTNRLMILFSWLGLWLLISIVIGSFTAIQWKRKK